MSFVHPISSLFRTTRKSLVQHTIKRGFLYSWKKGVSRDIIAWLQQPIDLSPSAVRRWLRKKEWQALVKDHSYIPERHNTLGPDLATAHFVVARNGAVKFEGIDRWIRKNESGKYYLPSVAQTTVKLEAVDASSTNMMYESFDNFVYLQHLKYLKLSNCPNIDDWCLDRFVQFRDSLLVLDVSGCPGVTERGLASLHKLRKLKRLFIYDLPNIKNENMIALMLEEAMPNCIIEGIDYTRPDLQDSTEINKNPAFLAQWEEFAHRKKTEALLAAEKDDVLSLVQKNKQLKSQQL